MRANITKERYVAFLRGINVGGHHKVPMAELRREFEKLNFDNIVTILNSGNIIFDAGDSDAENLENTISKRLEEVFGFRIPTVIRRGEMIRTLLDSDPFKDVEVTKEIRLYITFLWNAVDDTLRVPWKSEDNAFRILSMDSKTISSVLDLSISNTPKGMEILEKNYGKDMTTRNWNTIIRIGKKL